jgi:protein-L-isoaspartate(D-aspartate) O-methyltransferase
MEPRRFAIVSRALFFLSSVLLSLHFIAPCTPSSERPNQESVYQGLRSAMVESQIVARGITDTEVLRAMRAVPRHRFVPREEAGNAYDDRPLPIGHDQTISQPYIVALMTELLTLQKHDRVLEIGTGSGYQAAVLAQIVDTVFTIEIVKPLAESAAERLRTLGYGNVVVLCGDGYNGWPDRAPFDGIIVTAAADQIPDPLIRQLKEGGRMVIPAGEPWAVQELLLVEKKDGKVTTESVLPVRFVPLTREKPAR